MVNQQYDLLDALFRNLGGSAVEVINGWSPSAAQVFESYGFRVFQRLTSPNGDCRSYHGCSVVIESSRCPPFEPYLVYSRQPLYCGSAPVVVRLSPDSLHTLPTLWKYPTNIIRFDYGLFDRDSIRALYDYAVRLFSRVPDPVSYVCNGANGLLKRYVSPFSLVFDASSCLLYWGGGPFEPPFALAAYKESAFAPMNLEFFALSSASDSVPRPFCMTCPIREICPYPTFHESYLLTGDPLLPPARACAVHYAIVLALYSVVREQRIDFSKCPSINNVMHRFYIMGGDDVYSEL